MTNVIKMKYKTPADQKAIEAEKQYDALVDRIKHLRQTAVEANQRIAEMQADVEGDVALLTKQSIKEKRQAEECETEVSILLQRLAPLAEKVGAALHESRQEWRQISSAYDTAVDQATATALQDKELLLGVEKLKALLHSVKYPRVIMDCLLYTSPSPRDRTRSRMPSSA